MSVHSVLKQLNGSFPVFKQIIKLAHILNIFHYFGYVASVRQFVSELR